MFSDIKWLTEMVSFVRYIGNVLLYTFVYRDGDFSGDYLAGRQPWLSLESGRVAASWSRARPSNIRDRYMISRWH